MKTNTTVLFNSQFSGVPSWRRENAQTNRIATQFRFECCGANLSSVVGSFTGKRTDVACVFERGPGGTFGKLGNIYSKLLENNQYVVSAAPGIKKRPSGRASLAKRRPFPFSGLRPESRENVTQHERRTKPALQTDTQHPTDTPTTE